MVFGFDGVGAILDQHETVLLRDGHDGVHLAWAAREMHGDDGARARGNRGFYRGWIDVLGEGVDIGQHRRQPSVDDGVHRGAEGEGRGDDLAAGLKARGHHAHVQGGGAAVHAGR